MIIEESKALGAAILFFPAGKAVQAGGVCGPNAIPDPNDPGWVDFIRVEAWEGQRKGVKYEPVEDGTTGSVVLADEIETNKGYVEYKFTANVLLAFIIGLFYRAAAALTGASYQFDPNQGVSPNGWLILANKDQNGNVFLAANLWGKMKYDGPMKGGGGSLIKPDLIFDNYANNLNTIALGTP